MCKNAFIQSRLVTLGSVTQDHRGAKLVTEHQTVPGHIQQWMDV